MGLVETEKRMAAEAAAELVENGSLVGLGTGSTVAFLLPALARRNLSLRCVATSPATAASADALGLQVEPFAGIERLDIAIDGADQIRADGWMIKGGGAAHTREKVVAGAADRFVVIASSDKLVERLTAPVPFEALQFGLEATLAALAPCARRLVGHSPEGGVIADYLGEEVDPVLLASRMDQTPGVVSHGLFPPTLVNDLIVGRGSDIDHRQRLFLEATDR